MKKSRIIEIIKEVLAEQEAGAGGNTTGVVPGPSVPFAWSKKNSKSNKATKISKKILGMTPVESKKYPYSTDMIDYKKF
jgi:hypothetical protein